MKFSSAISAAALLTLASCTPTPVEKRADNCEEWGTIVTGAYTVYNNLWGQGAADSGSQCFGVDGLSGDTVSWHATWTWVGGPGQVKSYPNVVLTSSTVDTPQVSTIESIPSTWRWTYTGTGLITNVAYDLFTSSSPTGDEEFEIMIWLGRLGGAGPISENYSAEGESIPIATGIQAGGQTWDLYKGPNGQMTVFSFVPANNGGNVNNFSGDLIDFVDYLVDEQSFNESQYLISAGAGTEPFEGVDAVFTTSAYSITIE